MADTQNGSALERHKATFRLLQGSYLDAVALVTPEGRIASFNRTFFLLFSRQVARKLEGTELAACLSLALGEGPLNVVAECLGRGAAVRFDEVAAQVANRDPMTFIVSATPLPDDTNAPAAVLVVFRDVTDQAQIQVKYQKMLQDEEVARGELERKLRERTAALLAANKEFNTVQHELVLYKKGLRIL